MFVRDLMIANVTTISPRLSVNEALELMTQKKIRHLPVVNADGQLVGIISKQALASATPASSTTLSAWEIKYVVNKLKVQDVMKAEVFTIGPNAPLEEAAAILSDNKISGLPVVEAGKLVGIITDTDIFRLFTSLMGARRSGTRVTAVIPGVKGTLAKITAAIANAGGDILTLSEYQDEKGQWLLTLKVTDVSKEQLVDAIQGLVEKIVDVRDSPAIRPK